MCTSPLLSLLPSLPQATYCRGLKGSRLIPLLPFHFTTAPYWHISFLWVLGLCLSKRKQQLVLSQDSFFTHHHYHHDFLEGGHKNTKQNSALAKKTASNHPAVEFCLCFCHLHTIYYVSFLFQAFPLFRYADSFCLFVWRKCRGEGLKRNQRRKLAGLAPSFTCLIISGDEGHSQNPPYTTPSHALIRFVSRLSACVHLLTELPNESQAGMLIKESDMLLKIWPSASRWAPPPTGGCVSVEHRERLLVLG